MEHAIGRGRRLVRQGGLAVGLLALAPPALPPPAQAAAAGAAGFWSSFEPGDPQPRWISSVEVDASGRRKSAGVRGAPAPGLSGRVAEIVASGENTAAGEVKDNLVDGDPGSKWLTQASTGWIQLELSEPLIPTRYALRAGNDASAIPRTGRCADRRTVRAGPPWTAAAERCSPSGSSCASGR